MSKAIILVIFLCSLYCCSYAGDDEITEIISTDEATVSAQTQESPELFEQAIHAAGKLLKSGSYLLPDTITGLIKSSKITKEENIESQKNFYSQNSFFKTVLMFVHNQLENHIKGEKLEEFKNLRIPAKGCKLSFSLDSRARALALLFDKGMEIPEDEVLKAKPAEEPEKAIDTEKDVELGLESAEDDDEPGVQLGTHTLLLVIEKGMQVFGDHAKLDWSRLPNYKWKPSKNKLQKFVRYLPIILNQIKEAIKRVASKVSSSTWNILKKLRKTDQNQQTPEIDASIEKKQNERLTESAHRIAEIVKGDEKEELKGLDEEKAINENLSEIRKMKSHPADLLDSVRYKIHGAPVEFRNLSAEEYKMLVESMEKKNTDENTEKKKQLWKNQKKQSYKSKALESQNLNCMKLAELTEFALYHGSDDGSKDFRVRLGAQALNSIINAKRFTKETGMALSASFLFTVGIAVGLDGFAWPWVADAVASIFHGNKEHYAVVVLTFLLDSFTALLAETLDSALVSRFLDSLKGGNLIPNSLKEYAVDIKEASKSGMVAMFGNTFSQASDLLATLRTKPFFIGEIQKQKNKSKQQQKYGKTAIPYGFILVISLITNQIAASTSAAVVPKEVKETREYLVAELHNRYKSGFLSYPSELELNSIKSNEKLKEVEQGAEVARKLRIHNFIKETVTLSMKVSKSSATAINSMGVGSFISFAGFLTIDFVAHKLDWSNIVQKVATIALNGPTEIISMAFISWSSNKLGAQWMQKWLSTDKNKNTQILERLILDSQPCRNAKHAGQVSIQIEPSISLNKLNNIYFPKANWSFGYGAAVIKVMNAITPSRWGAKIIVNNNYISKIWGQLDALPKSDLEELGKNKEREYSDYVVKESEHDEMT